MTDYSLLKVALKDIKTDVKVVIEGLHIDASNAVSMIELSAVISDNVRSRIDAHALLTGKNNPGAYIVVLSFQDKMGLSIKLLKWNELAARGLLAASACEGWAAVEDACDKFGLDGSNKGHLFFLIVADSFGRKKMDWAVRQTAHLLAMREGYRIFKSIPGAGAVFKDYYEYPTAEGRSPASEKVATSKNLADDM
jgi:hypothetical protein